MTFEILNEKHIGNLAPIYVQTYNAPPWNDKWTIDLAAVRLDEIINCRDSFGLICFNDTSDLIGMIAGSFETYYDHKQFYIKDYFIVPEEQSKGVGTILIKKLEDELKSKGIEKIYLLTSRTEQTEGFYQKRGYNSWNSIVVMGKLLI